MKKKLLGILSLVLCLGMLLTSCSKGGKSFKDMAVDPYVNENPVLTAFVEDKVFDGEDVRMMIRNTFNGRYVLFNDIAAEAGEAYIALYDAKDSKVIKSWNRPVTHDENNNPVSYTDIANGIYGTIDKDGEAIAFYVAYKEVYGDDGKTVYYYTMYNLDGSEVYTEDIDSIYNFSIDSNDYDIVGNNLFINDCQYKIGAKLTKVESYNKFTYIPEAYEYNVGAEYLYKQVNNSVVIYDFDFNVVGTYYLPAVFEPNWYVLENGNIFCSGGRLLPEDAKDYDVLESNYKIDFICEIYNVEKDKVIELDFDNKIVDLDKVITVDDEIYNVFGGKIKNIVEVQEIEDHQINQTKKYMAMDNEGNLSEIPEIVPNQGEIYSSEIAGRYVVGVLPYDSYYETYSKYLLVDGNGNVLGDYNSVMDSIDEDLDLGDIMNDSYFISDDVIYDWNLNKVADKPEDYMLTGILANGFMFASRTEEPVVAGEDKTYTFKTYVFKNGAFTELTSYTGNEYGQPEVAGVEVAMAQGFSDQLYIVTKVTMSELGMPENAKIAIYNEEGTMLKEFTDIDVMASSEPFSMAIEAEDGSYVLLYSADGTVYKVAAAAQSVGA